MEAGGSRLGAGSLKGVLALSPINRLLTRFPPELITRGWPGASLPASSQHSQGRPLSAGVCACRVMGFQDTCGLAGNTVLERSPTHSQLSLGWGTGGGGERGGGQAVQAAGTHHVLVVAVPRSALPAGQPV